MEPVCRNPNSVTDVSNSLGELASVFTYDSTWVNHRGSHILTQFMQINAGTRDLLRVASRLSTDLLSLSTDSRRAFELNTLGSRLSQSSEHFVVTLNGSQSESAHT